MSARPDLVACWLFRLDPGGDLEILLIRRAPDRLYPGLWQCVTGKLEPGERIAAAARREVAEETGLGSPDIEAFYGLDLVNWFHEASLDALLSEAVFAARVRADAAIKLSHEHDDLRWLPPGEARALVTWPAYVRAIETVEWLLANPAKAGTFRLPDPI
ncbi:MAG: NUDIX domain-containing protein [Chloroflexota bacterium]|nr:MAG: NUDIX domain-containing protein [Chloroflexota bacterium]